MEKRKEKTLQNNNKPKTIRQFIHLSLARFGGTLWLVKTDF